MQFLKKILCFYLGHNWVGETKYTCARCEKVVNFIPEMNDPLPVRPVHKPFVERAMERAQKD